MTSSLNRFQTPLLAVILIVLGAVAFIWFGPTRVLEAQASEDWPTVEGSMAGTAIDSSWSKNSGTTWTVALRYRYSVGGKDYKGDRWSVNGPASFGGQDGAERFAAKLPEGHPVPVHYDPEDPARSVLSPGGSGKAWANLGFAVLIILLGIGLLIRWLVKPG